MVMNPNQAFKWKKIGPMVKRAVPDGFIGVTCRNCGEDGVIGKETIAKMSYEEFKEIKCGRCYEPGLSVKRPASLIGGDY